MTFFSNQTNNELQKLKQIFEARRTTGKRTVFPKEVRDRVLSLKASGLTVGHLRHELGISASQLAAWAKKEGGIPAKIVNVVPVKDAQISKATPPAPLCLQMGSFRVTIEVAEVA